MGIRIVRMARTRPTVVSSQSEIHPRDEVLRAPDPDICAPLLTNNSDVAAVCILETGKLSCKED